MLGGPGGTAVNDAYGIENLLLETQIHEKVLAL